MWNTKIKLLGHSNEITSWVIPGSQAPLSAVPVTPIKRFFHIERHGWVYFGPLERFCPSKRTLGKKRLRWNTESKYFELSECFCILLSTEMSITWKKCGSKYFSYLCLSLFCPTPSKIYQNFCGNWTTATFLPITFERNLVESPDWRHSTRHESGIPKMTLALRLELTLFVYTHLYELPLVGFMSNSIDVQNEKHHLAKKKKKKGHSWQRPWPAFYVVQIGHGHKSLTVLGSLSAVPE